MKIMIVFSFIVSLLVVIAYLMSGLSYTRDYKEYEEEAAFKRRRREQEMPDHAV